MKGNDSINKLIVGKEIRILPDGDIVFVGPSGVETTLVVTPSTVNRAITFPETSGNTSVVATSGNQTIGGTKTFSAVTPFTLGISFSASATMNLDSTTATAAAGAATLSKMAGVITSEALTTAAGADYVLTITNTLAAAGDLCWASVDNGTNTTEGACVTRVTVGAGTITIRVRNLHASAALNGTVKISFLTCKA